MGAYLSSPVTDKVSSDESTTRFTYGASSMQGWRISQEDAHNCIPEFDSEPSTALFAVYDGHGGSEVAQYCSKYLPDCIRDTDQYQEGDLGPGLVDAFLRFDSTLVQDDVIKELKQLAGVDENEEEEEEDDVLGRGEADDLRAEADLPLDELLAKYQTPPGAASARNLRKKENFQSPVVRAKQGSPSDDAGASSSTDVGGSSGASNSNSSSSSHARLTNGLADNENNLNKEKELQDNAKSVSDIKDSGDGPSISGSSSSDEVSSKNSSAGGSGSGDNKSIVSAADSSSRVGEVGGSGGCSSSSSGCGDVGSSSCSSGQSSGKSSDTSSDGVSSSTCVEEEGLSGSGSKAGGSSKGGKKGAQKGDVDMADEEDDSDEDDEDEWQDESGEEEEDEMEEADPIMDLSNEEPGSDSGCTACVALLRADQLVVANAGDSRCVLCRGGKAVELSFDHKPEDDVERNRIEKAGGKVTADGRVNGGLNLSRAIGDHFYKRKEEMSAEEQMITALPDIQTLALEPEDQFLVLACDGIWNSMSSQECVDFVAECLKNPAKKSKPSLICEELFDHCLAANTYGDGTGCDNMTCIIVVLHPQDQSEADGNGLIPSKRCVNDLEAAAENTEKRPRVEEGECASAEESTKSE